MASSSDGQFPISCPSLSSAICECSDLGVEHISFISQTQKLRTARNWKQKGEAQVYFSGLNVLAQNTNRFDAAPPWNFVVTVCAFFFFLDKKVSVLTMKLLQ